MSKFFYYVDNMGVDLSYEKQINEVVNEVRKVVLRGDYGSIRDVILKYTENIPEDKLEDAEEEIMMVIFTVLN